MNKKTAKTYAKGVSVSKDEITSMAVDTEVRDYIWSKCMKGETLNAGLRRILGI